VALQGNPGPIMELLDDFKTIDQNLFKIMMASLFKDKDTLKKELYLFLKKISGDEH
jgi:hypothetical protein